VSDSAAALLLAALGRSGAGADLEALSTSLEGALAQAELAWPGVSLSPGELLPFLAERLVGEKDVVAALGRLRVGDLFLACACLQGDLVAVEQFHARFMPLIGIALRRVDPRGDLTEDVSQMVYLKVFMPTDGSEPRIAQYAGRGDLGKWLQVVAVRVAQNVMRRQVKERQIGDSSLERLVSSGQEGTEELRFIKQLYREDFKAAFREALAGLSSRQRNILRHRLLDRMGLDDLAALYNVHRATVIRWIAAIRQQLLQTTREELGRRLRLEESEINSMVRVLRSQVDTSIQLFLGKSPPG